MAPNSAELEPGHAAWEPSASVVVSDETRVIVDAVRQTYLAAGLPWPPALAGPVPLDRLIAAYRLVHEEVDCLNHAAAAALLRRWDVRWTGIPRDDRALAGFVYVNACGGYVFVRRGDGLPRRRFTAAHELGHYRLHLAPELVRRDAADAEVVASDEAITEFADIDLDARERQANGFAAELLMPAGVCRLLHARCGARYGTGDRFAVYRLAAELLVSREAIAWRLYGLRLIAKPTWLGTDHGADDRRSTGEVG